VKSSDSTTRLVVLLGVVIFGGCDCSPPKLRTPDPCDLDPMSCEDAGPPPVDAGEPDAGEPPCTDVGAVTGRVCAPDLQTWVNGATVSVDAIDCNGHIVHHETVTAADGSFTLSDLPAKAVTVRAALGAFTQDTPVTVRAGASTAIPDNQLCVAQKAVRIAVVTGAGDKIEDLLTTLKLNFTLIGGDTSTWSTQGEPFLADLAQLKQYDLVFIDCAAAKKSGTTIDLGPNAARITQNLHDYVLQGGSVYSSDWGLLFTLAASPGSFTFATQTGSTVANPLDASGLMGFAPQTVSATVRDMALAQFLGKATLSITFPRQAGANSLHWGLLAAVPGAQVLVSANAVQTCADKACGSAGSSRSNVPLAARVRLLPAGQKGGNVVYTSFHNVAQSGDDVAQVLKYLVLNL
jgi:hypothetical protein